MPTNVYIDGFNLYYGAVKNRWPDLKWLDLGAFSAALLPGRQINRIRYFTARVIPSPTDPQSRTRQDIFLRALQTVPRLNIHLGRFVLKHGWRYQYPVVYPSGSTHPLSVQVQLPEEKGSDVNLATYLLFDCFNDEYDEAVIISTDSDLVEPIGIVVHHFKKTVGVINPHPKSGRSVHLANGATWTFQTVNRKYFAQNQFPPTLTDAKGRFSKPASW